MTNQNQFLSDERNFRPKTLDEFIGQGDLKKTLHLMLNSAQARSAVLEHIVFYGGPGLGKTTLAAITEKFSSNVRLEYCQILE